MVNKESIYVDGYNLRKLIRKSQLLMTKTDRILYGTPTFKECGNFLADFVMAYELKDRKEENIQKMRADFEILKLSLREIVEDHVLKGRDPDHGNISADQCRIEMFECVARIDEGITKWRNSVPKVKTGVK